MGMVKSGDATLYYEVHGEGPPLVLAHGAGGNTLSWWQQIPLFARDHRVIVFDHRGFGRSTCPSGQVHPAHFAGDLAAILDAEKVGRAALVCQSMGGWTGLGFALAQPARVSALVLAGTPAGMNPPAIEAGWQALAAKVGQPGQAAAPLGRSFRAANAEGACLYTLIAGLNPLASVQSLAKSLSQVRIEKAQLARHAVPTLLVAGEEDEIFSPEGLEEAAGWIPGARFVKLARVGHSTYFEDPRAFNRVVGEFLAAHRGA